MKWLQKCVYTLVTDYILTLAAKLKALARILSEVGAPALGASRDLDYAGKAEWNHVMFYISIVKLQKCFVHYETSPDFPPT